MRPRVAEVIREILREGLTGRGPLPLIYRFADVDANIEAVYGFHGDETLTSDCIWGSIYEAKDQLAYSDMWTNTWRTFDEQCPDFAGVAANREILVALYQKRWPGFPLEIEHLYAIAIEKPDIVQQLTHSTAYFQRESAGIRARVDEQEHRDQLTSEAERRAKMILSLTAGITGDPHRQDQQAALLADLSPAELQQRFDQNEEAKKLRKLSTEELRKIVKSEQKTFSQFADLPPAFEVPGKMAVTVPWSIALLKHLDSRTIGLLLSKYGEQALNEACRKGSQQPQ